MDKQQKATILLVGTVISNISELKKLFKLPGRELIHQSSGEKALKTILDHEIDLILLEDPIPDMSAYEMVQLLKTNRKTQNIPIIIVLADQKKYNLSENETNEGIDYLRRPLDPELAKTKISILLRYYLQQKELTKKGLIWEKYELLINNSPDIICTLQEPTLIIETVNESFCNVIGMDKESIEGTSFLHYLSNEDRKRVQAYLKGNEEKLSFEAALYGKDRKSTRLFWNIIINNDIILANARDVVKTQEAEEIRKHLSIVVKQSHNAIYMYNGDGKIISWNNGAEQIYGFTEAEALHMNIRNIIPEHLQEETQRIIDRLYHHQDIKAYETKRTTKYGKIIDVLFSAAVISNTQGEVVSVAITEKDITEQKRAENEIRQLNADLESKLVELELANEELESFSYSISHDLRSPLYFIQNEIKMIVEDYSEIFDIKLAKIIGYISRNVTNAIELTEELLKFSRSVKDELKMDHTDMTELVYNALQQYKNLNDRCEIIVDPLESAYCDGTLVQQVFSNLISNALKYSSKKKNPFIQIGSYLEKEETVYYVKDNGDGFNMNKENMAILFKPFKRLHTEEEFNGTGIGLALTMRIVTKHGGRIWVASQKGKGATFYFTLGTSSHNKPDITTSVNHLP